MRQSITPQAVNTSPIPSLWESFKDLKGNVSAKGMRCKEKALFKARAKDIESHCIEHSIFEFEHVKKILNRKVRFLLPIKTDRPPVLDKKIRFLQCLMSTLKPLAVAKGLDKAVFEKDFNDQIQKIKTTKESWPERFKKIQEVQRSWRRNTKDGAVSVQEGHDRCVVRRKRVSSEAPPAWAASIKGQPEKSRARREKDPLASFVTDFQDRNEQMKLFTEQELAKFGKKIDAFTQELAQHFPRPSAQHVVAASQIMQNASPFSMHRPAATRLQSQEYVPLGVGHGGGSSVPGGGSAAGSSYLTRPASNAGSPSVTPFSILCLVAKGRQPLSPVKPPQPQGSGARL